LASGLRSEGEFLWERARSFLEVRLLHSIVHLLERRKNSSASVTFFGVICFAAEKKLKHNTSVSRVISYLQLSKKRACTDDVAVGGKRRF
jgi:hypothetical protein